MSKGSTRRPAAIDEATKDANWARTFAPKPEHPLCAETRAWAKAVGSLAVLGGAVVGSPHWWLDLLKCPPE